MMSSRDSAVFCSTVTNRFEETAAIGVSEYDVDITPVLSAESKPEHLEIVIGILRTSQTGTC
jgi:hypothetical protein